MIPICFVLVTLVGPPDLPFRVYRGQNIVYGPIAADASSRTYKGARSVIYRPNGTLNVRETPEEIDRKPCHEPGAR